MTAESAPVPPVGTQLSRLAGRAPDAPALTCAGRTVTVGELDRAANRLARAYRGLGVGVGDYVSILLPNSIEFLEAAFAVWKLGAIMQPLPSRLPDSELDTLLDLVPRALLVGSHGHPHISTVPPGFTPAASLSDSPLDDNVSPALKAMLSGGSTGRPKLIETAADSRTDVALAAQLFDWRDTDTQLVAGPLSHNFPNVAATYGILLGQHVVLMERFDAAECLRLIAEHRVTWTVVVPTMMQRMLHAYRCAPEAYDLSSLRRLWHGAAPCPPSLKEEWFDLLGADAVWEFYGATEDLAGFVVSGSEWLTHRGSVGRAAFGEVKVCDDDGYECPPGVVGEIYMRPDGGAGATYRYIGSEPARRDGWDTVGDLGWVDDDGFLYLSDRRSDMFTVGGRNVYPAEIEAALAAHPEVLSCLVVGLPDDDLGQVPYALVERVPDSRLDAEGVLAFLTERIAHYKTPRGVEFRTGSLRDAMGKARRTAVRDELIAARAQLHRDAESPGAAPSRPVGGAR